MRLIPFTVTDEEYSLMVVLEQDNLARIQQYDPAEIGMDKLPAKWRRYRLKDVLITYATEAELEQVFTLIESGNQLKALRLLTRGFIYRPDQGDNDLPYMNLKSEGETKH